MHSNDSTRITHDRGNDKTSKYEIIAIFREEQRKQTEIEIFFNNKSISTQIARVDFAEFHIQSDSKIPAGNKFKFILHSDSGKIEFTSQRQKNSAGGAENSNKVAFALPECIQLYKDDEIRDFVYAMRMISFVMGAIKWRKLCF